MLAEKSFLIPPAQLLKEYGVTAEQFVELGAGFFHEYLIRRLRLQPHERVLDLGCGPGFHARLLAEYLTSGSYEGLDVMPSVIEFCQAAYSPYSNVCFTLANIQNSHYNPNGRYKQSDYKLPYKDHEFDLVYSVSLFTHLQPDEVASYLREIRRVVKSAGRCLGTFFLLNEETSIATDKAVYRFLHNRGHFRLLDERNPARAVAYDETWVKHAFASHRLRICEVNYGHWAGGRELLQSLQDIVVAVPI
jgi:SAM-dependent methyltransferase